MKSLIFSIALVLVYCLQANTNHSVSNYLLLLLCRFDLKINNHSCWQWLPNQKVANITSSDTPIPTILELRSSIILGTKTLCGYVQSAQSHKVLVPKTIFHHLPTKTEFLNYYLEELLMCLQQKPKLSKYRNLKYYEIKVKTKQCVFIY